jgi:hypothetical protein
VQAALDDRPRAGLGLARGWLEAHHPRPQEVLRWHGVVVAFVPLVERRLLLGGQVTAQRVELGRLDAGRQRAPAIPVAQQDDEVRAGGESLRRAMASTSSGSGRPIRIRGEKTAPPILSH